MTTTIASTNIDKLPLLFNVELAGHFKNPVGAMIVQYVAYNGAKGINLYEKFPNSRQHVVPLKTTELKKRFPHVDIRTLLKYIQILVDRNILITHKNGYGINVDNEVLLNYCAGHRAFEYIKGRRVPNEGHIEPLMYCPRHGYVAKYGINAGIVVDRLLYLMLHRVNGCFAEYDEVRDNLVLKLPSKKLKMLFPFFKRPDRILKKVAEDTKHVICYGSSTYGLDIEEINRTAPVYGGANIIDDFHLVMDELRHFADKKIQKIDFPVPALWSDAYLNSHHADFLRVNGLYRDDVDIESVLASKNNGAITPTPFDVTDNFKDQRWKGIGLEGLRCVDSDTLLYYEKHGVITPRNNDVIHKINCATVDNKSNATLSSVENEYSLNDGIITPLHNYMDQVIQCPHCSKVIPNNTLSVEPEYLLDNKTETSEHGVITPKHGAITYRISPFNNQPLYTQGVNNKMELGYGFNGHVLDLLWDADGNKIINSISYTYKFHCQGIEITSVNPECILNHGVLNNQVNCAIVSENMAPLHQNMAQLHQNVDKLHRPIIIREKEKQEFTRTTGFTSRSTNHSSNDFISKIDILEMHLQCSIASEGQGSHKRSLASSLADSKKILENFKSIKKAFKEKPECKNKETNETVSVSTAVFDYSIPDSGYAKENSPDDCAPACIDIIHGQRSLICNMSYMEELFGLFYGDLAALKAHDASFFRCEGYHDPKEENDRIKALELLKIDLAKILAILPLPVQAYIVAATALDKRNKKSRYNSMLEYSEAVCGIVYEYFTGGRVPKMPHRPIFYHPDVVTCIESLSTEELALITCYDVTNVFAWMGIPLQGRSWVCCPKLEKLHDISVLNMAIGAMEKINKALRG